MFKLAYEIEIPVLSDILNNVGDVFENIGDISSDICNLNFNDLGFDFDVLITDIGAIADELDGGKDIPILSNILNSIGNVFWNAGDIVNDVTSLDLRRFGSDISNLIDASIDIPQSIYRNILGLSFSATNYCVLSASELNKVQQTY